MFNCPMAFSRAFLAFDFTTMLPLHCPFYSQLNGDIFLQSSFHSRVGGFVFSSNIFVFLPWLVGKVES